jgi:hypothetical protein
VSRQKPGGGNPYCFGFKRSPNIFLDSSLGSRSGRLDERGFSDQVAQVSDPCPYYPSSATIGSDHASALTAMPSAHGLGVGVRPIYQLRSG